MYEAPNGACNLRCRKRLTALITLDATKQRGGKRREGSVHQTRGTGSSVFCDQSGTLNGKSTIGSRGAFGQVAELGKRNNWYPFVLEGSMKRRARGQVHGEAKGLICTVW